MPEIGPLGFLAAARTKLEVGINRVVELLGRPCAARGTRANREVSPGVKRSPVLLNPAGVEGRRLGTSDAKVGLTRRGEGSTRHPGGATSVPQPSLLDALHGLGNGGGVCARGKGRPVAVCAGSFGDRRPMGENSSITRRRGESGRRRVDTGRGGEPGPSGSVPEGDGGIHGVVHKFSPAGQGALCPTKFFGIISLFDRPPGYPRRHPHSTVDAAVRLPYRN